MENWATKPFYDSEHERAQSTNKLNPGSENFDMQCEKHNNNGKNV